MSPEKYGIGLFVIFILHFIVSACAAVRFSRQYLWLTAGFLFLSIFYGTGMITSGNLLLRQGIRVAGLILTGIGTAIAVYARIKAKDKKA